MLLGLKVVTLDFKTVQCVCAQAADRLQEQEAERNMTVHPNAQPQSMVWKYFIRADTDLFNQTFFASCHVKHTDFEVFRVGRSFAIPAREHSLC